MASILIVLSEGFNFNYDKIANNLSFKHYFNVVDLNFLIYTSMLGIILTYNYIKHIKKAQKEKADLTIQLTNQKMKFLQSQMQPHFLFNTLNGIHSLMDINIEKSKTMVVDLSDLLRSVLDKKDENLIELQEELEILKKYIHIKKTRFSDQLNIQLNVEAGLENILVPNMLIQPIVENSTKHGYGTEFISLEIIIDIYKKNDKLIIKVQNDGTALSEKYPTLLKKGTGLNNIKERLDTLYGINYKLKIFNESNKVITKVSFPIKLSISKIEKIFNLS
ncbi:sensor histidine kinase [Hwangdonia lutea]|uniref:Histidine kinase n=1 Tax=Hwangdonia lutea TaxID=3075823 RepID=A0AA97HP22_9FLAO|nr:histidine kinase [Hwangdonia sp. SCSIO 19198]WOD42152.1 histidine kinase [Hwangdonia sp. SCSIO 19198]